MDTTNLDSIRRKIRALTNLGNDAGATEAEAENALRFARALMLQHNVSAADIHEQAAEAERVTYANECEAGIGQKHSAWNGALAMAVSDLIGTVRCYRSRTQEVRRSESGAAVIGTNGQPETGASFSFYGPSDDVQEARAIFREWATTIAALARIHYGGALRGPGASWSSGFVSGMHESIQAMHREERALLAQHQAGQLTHDSAATSNALVLASALPTIAAKREAAAVWLRHEQGVRLGGSSRRASVSDSGAYSAGRAVGRQSGVSRATKQRRLA